MSIKKLFSTSLLALSIAGIVACDKGSSTSPDEDSSSSVASFKSSSSFSTERADISYKGEVSLGDTLQVNIEFCKKDCSDTTDRDPSETYIDSTETVVPLYLGKIAKGSRIKIYAKTSSLDSAKIRIRSEQGDSLRALTAIPKKAKSTDSIFAYYFVPDFGSDSTKIFKDSNEFVVFQEDHYYMELSGKFTNESTLRLKAIVDTAYYNYTGDTKSVNMKMTDTVRGIIVLNDTLKSINIDFAAAEGYSVNLKSVGKNIVNIELKDGDKKLGAYSSSGDSLHVDTLLVPNDSINWSLNVTTEEASFFFLTGPFAFFEIATKARALEQGEYFARPDSIKMPGKVLTSTRPKDDPDKAIYKYNLRQEQYVWLGDFKKGDSIRVEHRISNYSDENRESPVTIEIIDKNQKVQASVSSVYGGSLKVSDDMPEGPYYLHYLRLNSSPLDQVTDSMRYVLQLHTLMQQIGSVESMEFYNQEQDNTVKMISRNPGDSIRFETINFFTMNANKDKGWEDVGDSVRWYVPCASLDYINSTYKKSSCESNGSGEQLISSNYLVVQNGFIGSTAKLIAQSVADPSMRDTLGVLILKPSDD